MRSVLSSIICACVFSVDGVCAPMLSNADFESGTLDHWRTHMPPPFFRVTSDVTHTGKFALRGQGNPGHRYNGFAFVVRPLELTPVPGARYRIAGHAHARLAPGKKRVQLAVREVNADDKTIRYAGPHVQANTQGWRHYSHTFRASDGTVAFQIYIILSALETTDVVHFDDIGFECLTPVKAPITARPDPFDASRPPTQSQVLMALTSPEMEAAIDGTTGLLHSLTLQRPNTRVLHPAAEATTCIFLQRGDTELRFTADSGKIKRQDQHGAQTVATRLSAELPLRASVTYRMTADCFEEQVVFEADGDIDGLCRLGVRHGFVPGQWQRIICALRPIRAIAAGEKTTFCYGGADGDLCRGRLDRWQSVTYPLTVLEGDDRFVVVGNPSADCFATFAPNEPQGYFPSVQQNPFRIRKGDRFTFSLVYKVLPKETCLLRDAWRWFAARLQSEDPLLRGCLPYAPSYPSRTLPEGCHASASGHYTKRGLQIDTRRTIPGSNIWYFGWHDWIRERYPTSGSWWAGVAGWVNASSEPFRAELQRHRDAGFKCYLYFRQIANLSRADLPASWVKKVPGGALELYGGGYFKALPKKVAREVGCDEIRWGTYDFDNRDFRRQYLSQVKSCMSYYHPAGVAWDMGWRPGHPGILAVQAATYRWLRQQYPGMRVISNEASGTPTQFFSDAILIENGIVYGKSWYDYEVTKAFNTYCATLERPEFFVRLADQILSGKRNWPWREGAADAKRFIDHLTSTSALASIPAKQRSREVAFHTNVRAGLRDLAMGSNWGYADMTQLAFSRELPGALIQFMSAIPAIPAITRSYALRLNGKSDRDGDLYAAGWCDAKRLRLAVFNDSTSAKPFSLAIEAQALSDHDWSLAAQHKRRAYALTSEAALVAMRADWRNTPEAVSIRSVLPAFTLSILTADLE